MDDGHEAMPAVALYVEKNAWQFLAVSPGGSIM